MNGIVCVIYFSSPRREMFMTTFFLTSFRDGMARSKKRLWNFLNPEMIESVMFGDYTLI
jgi:hypothetical protein